MTLAKDIKNKMDRKNVSTAQDITSLACLWKRMGERWKRGRGTVGENGRDGGCLGVG